MKVLSLFSGIGAFEKALERLKMPYELVNYCEIDKYASKSYSMIHKCDESLNLGDITKIDTSVLPNDIDLITYGFPCQDISLAGKQKGFEENGERTRSGLFFEALRIIEDTKPRIAIAENVKNLTSKKFKKEFEIVLSSLEEVGYNNYWKVLNAKDYGIPQNRERVFIVSIRKDIDNGMFEFPQPFELKLRLKDMLEDEVDEKYYTKKALNIEPKNNYIQWDNSGKRYNSQEYRGYYLDSLCPTLLNCNSNGCKSQIVLAKKDDVFKKNKPILTEPIIVASRGRNPNNPSSRVTGEPTEQRIEVNTKGLANTLTTVQKDNYVLETKILKTEIKMPVRVRKYEVDCESLVELLRSHKGCFTNKEISIKLDVPITKVEHWFRKDDSFAIPDCEVWCQLKELLNIKTDEFDKSIMTFEEREGVYEKSNRCYHEDGIAPTLTSTSADEKIILDDTQGFDGVRTYNDYSPTLRSSRSGLKVYNNLRIRKLTPLECFRLMGFDDEDFHSIKGISNTQLYKQAGNSICVPVLEHIFKKLFDSGDKV